MAILDHKGYAFSRPQDPYYEKVEGKLGIWRDVQYNGRTCCQGEEVDNSSISLFMNAAGSTGYMCLLVMSGMARGVAGAGLV